MNALLQIILILFAFNSASSNDHGDSNIRIVGSVTAFPFMSVAIEDYAKFNNLKSPLIEANGTGSGVKAFCTQKKGEIDMVVASRKITEKEVSTCQENGIEAHDIEEINFGYDGIVIASKGNISNLSSCELIRSLSMEKYHQWSDIKASLPNSKIEIYGPNDNSGTRDALNELLFEKNYMDPIIRKDGSYIISNSNNMIIWKLKKNRKALGIVGFSFFLKNQKWLKPVRINNISPSFETIRSGKYPLARPLYVYVKKSQINQKKTLSNFVKHLKSDHLIGKNGYLTKMGLVTDNK